MSVIVAAQLFLLLVFTLMSPVREHPDDILPKSVGLRPDAVRIHNHTDITDISNGELFPQQQRNGNQDQSVNKLNKMQLEESTDHTVVQRVQPQSHGLKRQTLKPPIRQQIHGAQKQVFKTQIPIKHAHSPKNPQTHQRIHHQVSKSQNHKTFHGNQNKHMLLQNQHVDLLPNSHYRAITPQVQKLISGIQTFKMKIQRQFHKTKAAYQTLELHRQDSHQNAEVTDGTQRQKLISYILKKKESIVLSRGCSERGLGGQVTSLVFVKVHKSASTTVANVMARYALRHALNVALPLKMPGQNRFNYFEPKIVPEGVIPTPLGQQYEVLFNHMIFNRHDLHVLMPKQTFYFAIARNPEDRFVSSFIYYHLADHIRRRYNVSNLKDAVKLMISHSEQLTHFRPEVYNSLAGDTGLHYNLHRDRHAIQAHVQQLEEDLDLVMIVEYFDESLILLKRKACLSMQDILYVVKNARASEEQARLNLTQREKLFFKDFQMADFMLYDHFYKRFWEQVYAENADFFQEVRHFKEIQRTVGDFCRGQQVSPWDFMVIPRSDWNEEFLVTGRDCRLMKMPELTMQTLLMERAVKLYLLRQHLGTNS